MPKFQLISDIHLELAKKPISIEPCAPNLILAGDICPIQKREILEPFIRDVSQKFENVIYVPGNHEYYSGKRYCKWKWDTTYFPANVHFLDNKCVTIDGVKIVGSTLWTNIPYEDMYDIRHLMNDYKHIYSKPGQRISIHTTNDWHEDALKFLEKEIDTSCLVVTHHAPMRILDKEKGMASAAYYASDVPYSLIALSDTWCYGHTHKFTDVEHITARIISNPMGYEGEDTGYVSNFVFEVN